MDIKKVISDFPKQKIAVVGDIMLDNHLYGSVERVSPEAPVPVVSVENEVYGLGGAANVAKNINSLGGEAFLLGYVGQDEAKDHLIKLLQEKRIDNFLLPLFSHTIQKTRILGNGQHQIVRIDKENGVKISKENGERLIEKINEINPDLIIVSDYAKGTITQELFSGLIRLGKKVIVDPKPKNNVDYSGAYLITPNLKEGIGFTGSNNINEIGKILQKKYGSNILLTLGKDGMIIFEKEKVINIPTQIKEVYDVTGAGDSVVATLGLSISSGLDLTESAFLANQVAGLVVGKPRAATVSNSELKRLIELEDTKIKTVEELKSIREDYRRKGKIVVFTNGCYDILHPGHMRLLKKAKSFGDILILAINGDQSSFFKTKGDNRPILDQNERVEVLSGLEPVDYVTIFNEDTPCEIISILKPDIHVKGGDYDPNNFSNMPEAKIIKEYGGRIEIFPIDSGHSTTKLINKIKDI